MNSPSPDIFDTVQTVRSTITKVQLRTWVSSLSLCSLLWLSMPGANAIESDRESSLEAGPSIVVTLLGTGTPIPNTRQQGQSVLVEAGGERLLFDCGRGCASQLWNVSHDHLRKTHDLFLTHMHSDHTVGVADLLMNGWNLGRTESLSVYGPPGAATFMQHTRLAYEEDVVYRADLQIHTVTRETLGFDTTTVEDGNQYTFGDVVVTAFSVDHYVVEQAFGFRVDYQGHSVVISGDTAYSENLIRYSANTDVLIHEVMSGALEGFIRKTFPKVVADDIVALHTLAPDVGRVFTKSKTKLGVLTHFNNDPTGVPGLRAEISSTFDGEFVVGQDLMRIEIGDEIKIVPAKAP